MQDARRDSSYVTYYTNRMHTRIHRKRSDNVLKECKEIGVTT